MPGAPVTAVPWGNRIALFIADRGGGVFTTAGDPQNGWGPWASVSQGSTTPGAPVTAVNWNNRIALYLADPNGGVFNVAGDPQTGFGPWASVSQGSTMPGAPVSVVASGNRNAVFVADRGGGIFSTTGDPQAGWGAWTSPSPFPPAPAGYRLGVLPPEPTPMIPDGDDIILYLHGGPGSRLEEASDLVPQLHISGLTRKKRYTVIAFDQPSQGYSSMLGPDEIVASHDLVGDKYPTLVFSEDFIVAFVEALDKIVPIKHRNIYIIGGSTGGALALRMGHRPEPWIKRIVAWSCACVWTTWANDALKGAALHAGFARSEHGEDGGRRGEFFDNTFGPTDPGPLVDLVSGIIQPNPEEWYRGDRDSAIKEWPCKWDFIAAARLDYEEVYNWRFRRWHWRMGTEELLFSFFNDSWQGPANTASEKQFANYWTITKPTLLAAAEDDNWDEGNGQHWENRWDRTWEIAKLMANTPGYTLLLPYTGHSIHNERPILFAKQITAFLSDPHWDTAGGPLQPPTLYPKSQMEEEDQNCTSPLPRYPHPPEALLAIPESATKLTQPAPKGGLFPEVIGDPRSPTRVITHSPGTYGLRLKQELRDIAAQCNPVVALGNAAARYYLGDPMWAAFADLAVTGRLSYEALRSKPPTNEQVIVVARAVLKAPSLDALDENKLADAVLTAMTRAYKVAWVLRDPDREEGYRLRPAWGWIAVSGEDDAPARPVNVASGLPILGPDEKTQVSTHPQFEIGVQMFPTPYYSPVSFQIRYSIASPPNP
jgi:pimeloyl-ACP methyl ester carboxylesterase